MFLLVRNKTKYPLGYTPALHSNTIVVLTFASSVLPRLLYSDPSLMYTRNGGTGPPPLPHASSIMSSTALQASAASEAFAAPSKTFHRGRLRRKSKMTTSSSKREDFSSGRCACQHVPVYDTRYRFTGIWHSRSRK